LLPLQIFKIAKYSSWSTTLFLLVMWVLFINNVTTKLLWVNFSFFEDYLLKKVVDVDGKANFAMKTEGGGGGGLL
jgi:hypothetical protein